MTMKAVVATNNPMKVIKEKKPSQRGGFLL